jgi:VWFA-related protein
MGACFALACCTLLARASSAGVDLVIMLDMSMGDTGLDPIIRTLSAGARVAGMELKPGDRVSLMSFSGSAKTILPLTDDIGKFESALQKTGNWIVERSQRHLYDSLLTALSKFPEGTQADRRRCIVVFTTASDVGSRHTAGEVALAARSKSAAIFVALISPQPLPPNLMSGRHVRSNVPNEDEEKKALEPLVRETGGDIRVYAENQYVIARAVGDMVNGVVRPISGPLSAVPGPELATDRLNAEHARLITLDVQAVDARTGQIPELLGPHDFEVYDDGQKIPIRKLDIDTPPMDLVFLIYLTKPGLSTAEDRRRYAQGLKAAVTTLRPGDRAAVIRGSGPRGESLSLTGDPAAIRQALLRGVQPDKGRLFDAVASALSLLSGETSPTRRRAIIAITDDIERRSETKEDALKEGLLRAGVTLHEVMVALAPMGSRIHPGGPASPGLHIPPISGVIGGGSLSSRGSLVDLVRSTGGEDQPGDEFDTALPGLIHRLRMRYMLTIAVPAAARAFHNIEVRLTPQCRTAHPDVTVRTRTGYYSEP